MKNSSCLVVFSGGQDSTTCLHWAMKRFKDVQAIFFQYGQRHQKEECAAHLIADLNKIKLHTFPLDFFKHLGGNALVNSNIPIEANSQELPNTFVPGRNLLFLTCAASFAYNEGIQDLITGVCQTDYSGYPDCRENTIKSLNQTISLGLNKDFTIHTPLMHLNKAESVRLAVQLKAMDSLRHSHTCYEGVYPPCGNCPSCLLRAKGFKEAGIIDPLLPKVN